MTTLFPIESTEPATPKDAPDDHAPQYLRLDTEIDGELPALTAATLIRGRASEALDLRSGCGHRCDPTRGRDA